MSNKILTKYINEMYLDNYFDAYRCEMMSKIRYVGDGQGDFEEIADDAIDEIIVKYIQHCKQQISLAKTELKRKTDERNARKIKEEQYDKGFTNII